MNIQIQEKDIVNSLLKESTIYTYIDKICEKYPNVSKKDIEKILKHGWSRYYRYNLLGGDTLIKSYKEDVWFYTGQLTNNSISYFNYYKFKLCKKLRIMYLKKKIKWDGYYYVALDEADYNLHFPKNKKGRKKVNFKFDKVKLFKIYDECRIHYSSRKAIIKFKYFDVGTTKYKDTIKVKNPEIVLIRDKADGFKEILAENIKFIK